MKSVKVSIMERALLGSGEGPWEVVRFDRWCYKTFHYDIYSIYNFILLIDVYALDIYWVNAVMLLLQEINKCITYVFQSSWKNKLCIAIIYANQHKIKNLWKVQKMESLLSSGHVTKYCGEGGTWPTFWKMAGIWAIALLWFFCWLLPLLLFVVLFLFLLPGSWRMEWRYHIQLSMI